MTSNLSTTGLGSGTYGSWGSPTATRGASVRCSWIRMAALSCCSRRWTKRSLVAMSSPGRRIGASIVSKSARWILAVTVGLLASIGVGASAAHYLQDPYNPGFLDFPTVVALHVVLGGVYLALAPFQFVRRIRSRHLNYHRWAGRMLVSVGVVVGVTALFMGLVIPFSGWPERVVVGLFGSLFLFALVKGFVHVRTGRVALHREWMIRAFAIGLAIATQRVIFFPALMITMSDPADGRFGTLLIAALAAAFVVHASVAETWIRATRRSGAPKAGKVKTV